MPATSLSFMESSMGMPPCQRARWMSSGAAAAGVGAFILLLLVLWVGWVGGLGIG